MVDEINYDEIGIDVEHDILFLTVSKYKLFLSHGKNGMDALTLYLHLMFTARLQKTNCVKANNIYIRQGLNWTKERLRKAKNLLFDFDLVSQIQRKDKKTGKFTGFYLEIKTKTSFLELKTSDLKTSHVENQTGGFLTSNALTNKQMLKQKNKDGASHTDNKKTYTDDVIKTTEYFIKKMMEKNGDITSLKNKPPKPENWYKDMQRIFNRGFKVGQLIKIIDWVYAHEGNNGFSWGINIRSVSKLDHHLKTGNIEVQMNKVIKKQKQSGSEKIVVYPILKNNALYKS